MDDRFELATLALHADDGIEPGPDIAPPLHPTTTYAADNPQALVYSRNDQATRNRLEAVLGALEGGYAVVYASGLAAVSALLQVEVLFTPSAQAARTQYDDSQLVASAAIPGAATQQ